MSVLRLSQNLFSPYDIMCRFLEQIPDGLTYDVLQAKLPALKRLKPKELDALLHYTEEKDRVFVVRAERKGAVAQPLLRHKMYGKPTVVNEPEPVKTENTVYVASAGKSELKPNDVKKAAPVEPTTPVAPETVSLKKDVAVLRMKHLDIHMHVAAKEIMAHLSTVSTGVTRTELGNAVVSYHRLRGANRQVVLSYLVAHEGVVEIQPMEGTYRQAPKFLHPSFVQPLDKSEKPYDHSAPELTLDPIVVVEDPALKTAHAVNDAPVTPVAEPEPPVILSLADIGNEIIEVLKGSNEDIPMWELHHILPSYHNLSDNERRECVNALVRSDRVRTYRVPNNHTGTLWIKLYSAEEKESDRISHQTAPVGETALAAAFKDAQDKAPMPELKPAPTVLNPQDFAAPATPVDDVPAPVAEPTSILPAPAAPLSSVDLRSQIAQLTALAAQMEQKEENENLRAVVLPLRDAVVSEYANVQAALALQTDAVMAMGLAIEKLNQALGGVK